MELISDILNVFFSDTEREIDDTGEQEKLKVARLKKELGIK